MNLIARKKPLWYLCMALFLFMVMANIILLIPYENHHKTTVEPIEFSGTYQLSEGVEPEPLTENTYIDACENNSVILRGGFNRLLQKDVQLLFFMEYLEVHIYLGEEEIYSWGEEGSYSERMKSAGAAWGHCTWPVSVPRGEEVTISLESKYTTNYNSAYHDFLDSLQTGDSGALARGVLQGNWYYLLAGLLLFLVGLTLQLAILSLAKHGVAIHASIYYCVLFILTASLWIILNPEYSTLIFDNSELIMLLETISMWLFSTFMCGYLGAFMQTKAKEANRLLMLGFALTLMVFLVFQLFGIIDAYAVREIHNLLLIISCIVLVFILRYEISHEKESELRTLALPGLLYVVFGIIEMMNYEFEWLQRGAAMTVGFTIFIIAQFIIAIGQIRRSLLQAVILEKDLAESRRAVMLSQIQPHFLYSALTGIKTLCNKDPKRAEAAMEHFAFFLRSNLDALSNVELISLDKEISHVEDYFYLEKLRFGDRVSLVLELDFREFKLPPLTLQPLVENAVRYGITKREDGGTVTIHSQKTQDQIIITITDDGVGFDIGAPKEDGRSHTGIDNVRGRLKLQSSGRLEIKSEKNVGTQVRITLQEKET